MGRTEKLSKKKRRGGSASLAVGKKWWKCRFPKTK